MSRKFPFTLQTNVNDCGPCCLRMIGQWYGKTFSLDELRTWCRPGEKGTTLSNMEQAAQKMGLDVLPSAMQTELLTEGKIPLPAILHWKNHHYVVLCNVRQNRFRIADPNYGIHWLEQKEFEEKWITGNEHIPEGQGIVLLLEPNESFIKDNTGSAAAL